VLYQGKKHKKSQFGAQKNVRFTKGMFYQMYAKSRLELQRQRAIQSVQEENVR